MFIHSSPPGRKLFPQWLKKRIAWMTLFLFTSQPLLVAAETVADNKAPEANRPRVETTQNGTPIVQITAPTAGGVSRNIYQRFDVDPQGLILNNSRGLTQTQLAGYITGNPNLAKGSAKIILNEVSGSNPSYLKGYTEVAGSRAEVIIANPNGIVGNGFGFINTSRAVLTTGIPIFGGNGSLEAFRVTGGQISIEGNGMDANSTDRADLISRAVAVNAGIWGKEVNVVAGANQVEHDSLNTTALPADENKPQVAIDVSALGGMYANKIRLVGTEQGVGVNSQGVISATGDITITNDGKVQLANQTIAGGNLSVSASEDISNQGTLYGAGNTQIRTQGNLDNAGLLAAGTNASLEAQDIHSTGTLAAGVKTDGTLGAAGDLTIQANGTLTTRGDNLSAGSMFVTAGTMDLANSKTLAQKNITLQAIDTVNNTDGDITAGGNLDLAANRIVNQSGKMTVQGNANISGTQGIDNTNGQILAQQDMTISNTGQFNNAGGSAGAGNNLSLQASTVENTNGQITTEKDALLDVQQINGSGKVVAGQDMNLSLSQDFVNGAGSELKANRNLTVNSTGTVTNEGSMSAVTDLTATAAKLVNGTDATLAGGTRLETTAEQLNNKGLMEADTVSIKGDDVHNTGEVYGDNVSITANNLTNEGPAVIAATQDAKLFVKDTLANKDDASIISLHDITIAGSAEQEDGKYKDRTKLLLNQSATIEAENNIGIYADEITNKKREFAVEEQVVSKKTIEQTQSISTYPGNGYYYDEDGNYQDEDGNYQQEDSLLPAYHNNDLSTLEDGTYNTRVTTVYKKQSDTETIKQTVITKDSSTAKILAGQDLTLQANIINNDLGWILAANSLNSTGILNNTSIGLWQTIEHDFETKYIKHYFSPYHFSGGATTGNYVSEVSIYRTEKTYGHTETTEQLPSLTSLFGGGNSVTISGGEVHNETVTPSDTIIGSNSSTLPPGQGSNSGDNNSPTLPGTTINLPNSKLYTIHTEPTSQYLVETDPRFANYKTFISSDYMLENLGLKPEEIQKRLGDGFYEQKLVQEQIASLTGRTNLTSADSKEEEYKNLMDNGIAYAKEYNLQVGVALTAEQMANLTTDMVWMVEQEVEGQKVLVPIVYLSKVRQEELQPSGALITADQVSINTTGDITNSGVIKGNTVTDLTADNIVNRGGRIEGSSLTLDAQQDILNQSGTITGDQVLLKAERDIKNETLTSPMSGNNGTKSSTTHQVATISAGKDLTVDAGRDITISGAQVSAGQNVDLYAGRDVEVNSVEHQQHTQMSSSTGKVLATHDKTTNLTSSVQAGNVVNITAKNDINIKGAQIDGQDSVKLDAKGDITVESVTDKESGSIQIGGKRSVDSLSYSKTKNVLSDIQSGGNVEMISSKDITIHGADIAADKSVSINAGENLTVSSVQDQSDIEVHTKRGNLLNRTELLDAVSLDDSDQMQIKSNLDTKKSRWGQFDYTNSTTEQVASTIQAGESVTLKSNKDTSLQGTQVVGSEIKVTAGGDISLIAAKDKVDESSFNGTSKNYKRTQTSDETVQGTVLSADNNITLQAGTKASGINDNVEPGKGSITITGSALNSNSGTVKLDADKDVTINEASERHESLVETKKTKSGFLSKKTTIKRDYASLNEAVGSTVSGTAIDIDSGNDITVKASSVVGTNDVDLNAKHDLNLESAAETGASEHYKYTKKSGLFSGGGLGITIGKQSEKLTVNEKTIDQVGSTVGSINGNVNLTADNQVQSAGATLIAGKDINITGKDITIDNTVDTYDSKTKYEFKQSGITVSLGGGVVDTAKDAVNHIQRSGEVSDERLKALYDYKASQDIKELGKDLKGGINKENLKKDVSVNISIGSSKTTTEQTVHTETVNPSNITAGQAVNITATTDDITLQGTKVDAKDVKLDAAGDINLTADQNLQQTNSKSESSSWSAGVSLNAGAFGNASKGNSKENGTVTTNTGTVINASDKVDLISDKDTNIIGSQVKGDQVTTDIKGDLNIISLQDTDTYAEKTSSSGIGFTTGPSGGVTGSISKGKTNSDYASVTEQAGIYAGEKGFDVEVGGNTDLKGAVISSEATPDKNKLSTDTLTYSDIQNKAEYSASSKGYNYDSKKYNPLDKNYKNQGLTPVMGVTTSGDADSTTHSAISNGTIDIRSNPSQDISSLSRDTSNALNSLEKIFDKKTVEERQELAQVFGEEAFKAIGDLGLKPGSAEKAAITAVVGGIMAQLGGSSFISGAAGAGFTELVMNEIAKISDPAMRQWVAYVLGRAAASLVGGDEETGGSTSISKIRNNDMDPTHIMDNPVFAAALYLAGFEIVLVDGQQRIMNKAGEVLATWNSAVGSWLDSAGNAIGNSIDDFYVWAKSGGDLKRMPKGKIDELGGEDYTSQVKEKTGKSKSNLYWNPKTGDVYSVPNGGGEPEWVDTVEP